MNATDFTTGSAADLDATDRVQAEYHQLRKLAARKMAQERRDHLLTATALANEVSVRMLTDNSPTVQNRDQFLAYAATAMGHLLIDHARARQSQKRGGGRRLHSYDESLEAATAASSDMSELTDALTKLRQVNARGADVVRLRYFDGLSNQEIAEWLNVSLATVKRDWERARLWLQQRLTDGG